jgi:hypothetical protein
MDETFCLKNRECCPSTSLQGSNDSANVYCVVLWCSASAVNSEVEVTCCSSVKVLMSNLEKPPPCQIMAMCDWSWLNIILRTYLLMLFWSDIE